MIQQGQVDRILHAKAEDVRQILEEAAGTHIFRSKKIAVEKKIDTAGGNLARIEDLFIELKSHIEAISEQVKQANLFNEFSSDLKKTELALIAHNYRFLLEKRQKIKDNLQEQLSTQSEFLAKIADLEVKHTELQGDLDESDPLLEEYQEEITAIREKIAHAEGTIKAAATMAENSKERLPKIDEEIREANENLSELEERLSNTEAELNSALAKRQELEELSQDYRDEIDRILEAAAVYKSRCDELEDDLKDLDLGLESGKMRREGLIKEERNLLKDADQTKSRMSLLENDIKEIDKAIGEVQKTVSARQSGIEQKVLEKQGKQQAIAKRQDEINELKEQKDAIREQYITQGSRRESLLELIESRSDVAKTLKHLREEGGRSAELIRHGLAVDYLAFNDSAGQMSEVAQNALQLWAERIVVDDFDKLNELVERIKSANLPTSGVSVLCSYRFAAEDEAKTQQWAQDFDAVALVDFIEIDEGNGFLTDFFRHIYYLPAVYLSDEELENLPFGIVVVTASGIIISNPNDLTIGARDQSGSATLKTDIEDLTEALAQSQKELTQLQTKIDQLQAQTGSDKLVIEEIDESLKGQDGKTLEILAHLQSMAQQKEHKEELLGDSQRHLTKLESDIGDVTQELQKLEQNRDSLIKQRGALKRDIASLREEREEVEDQDIQIKESYEQKKLDLERTKANEAAIREKFDSISNQTAKLQTFLTRRYDERSRIEEEINQSKNQGVEYQNQIEGYIKKREQLEAKLAESRAKNSATIDQMRLIEEELNKGRRKQSDFERLKSNANVEVERIAIILDSLKNEAEEKYHLELASYEFEVDPGFDAKKTSTRVKQLRAKIEDLGPVNMMALEEHKKLSERHDFVAKQKQEIIESIALLREAIAEIEDTATIKFMETFKVIDKNFQELFPILFPGGDSYLKLTNEEDPLEGGVDIMVRLPGKTTQSMSLFSGGEKALTAIALVFALLKTKPTPFCFLDEVDAPLDEANVGRYNSVLEVLAGKFQFIIITHNRRTMEVLDQLYGITMQEGGVSKVVGVDLQKDLPPHLAKPSFSPQEGSRSIQGATVTP